jgi:hypothetical protein
LSLPRKYGYIFIPEGSFSLITSEAVVLKSLNSFYEHLLPKSKLAIEVFTPKAGIKAGGRKTKDWFRVSETTFLSVSRETSYDPGKQIQRCISRYEMVKEGYFPEEQFETIEIRLYQIEQFRSLLDKAGFSFITVEGTHENNRLESEDITMVFTGIKP